MLLGTLLFQPQEFGVADKACFPAARARPLSCAAAPAFTVLSSVKYRPNKGSCCSCLSAHSPASLGFELGTSAVHFVDQFLEVTFVHPGLLVLDSEATNRDKPREPSSLTNLQ